MYGITFEGHPDLRHLYLPGEFEGFPLPQGLPAAGPDREALARHRRRRAHAWREPGDVDSTGESRPMWTARREPPTGRAARGGRGMTAVSERDQLRYIAQQAADVRVNVELETEGMTLNMGPQHPATHGTLRIVAKLDGEQVVAAEPVAGYMHRGYEKLTEVRTYPQVTTLVNRIDWVGSFANEVPVHPRRRALMDIEAPPRAQYIRTVLFEMSRIANIVLFAGDMALQVGGATAGLLRLPRPRVRPQPDRVGHRRPVPPELRPHRWAQGRPAQGLDRRHQGRHGQGARLLRRDGRPRHRQRDLRDPDPRHRRDPRRRRPVLRALRRQPPGHRRRLGPAPRRRLPGLVHDQLDWKVWTHPDGDSFARFWVRLQEIREATKIVDQCLDGLPAGPVMAKVPRIIKVPEARPTSRPRTRSAPWATTSSARATSDRSG